MAEQRAVEVGDLTFQVTVAGPADGETVLMLHGFPQTSRMWRAPMVTLAERGYRVVAPDQRGYSPGARPAAVDAYGMSHLTADAVGVLDALGVERAHVVGHDWGGVVAWNLGGRHADRLRTLTVVSTPHPIAFATAMRDESTDQAARSSYMFFFRRDSPEPEGRLLRDDSQALRDLMAGSGLPDCEFYVDVLRDPATLTAALNWYRASRTRDGEGLESVSVPTLYVWGTEDLALGRAAAERTGDYVSGPYRFEVLEGAGHWVAETHPEKLTGLLLEHLADQSEVSR